MWLQMKTCVTTQHNTPCKFFPKMLGEPCNYNGFRNLGHIVVGREPSWIKSSLSLQTSTWISDFSHGRATHLQKRAFLSLSCPPVTTPTPHSMRSLLLDIHSWWHRHLCAQLAGCLFRHQARLIYCMEYCMADCRTASHWASQCREAKHSNSKSNGAKSPFITAGLGGSQAKTWPTDPKPILNTVFPCQSFREAKSLEVRKLPK